MRIKTIKNVWLKHFMCHSVVKETFPLEDSK